MSSVITNARINDALTLLLELAHGNFAVRGQISGEADSFDAIIAGLNMLAEELSAERRLRARAEEDLRAAADAYDSAPDLFCSVEGAKAIIVQCNRTLFEALGATREQLIGRPLRDIYLPEAWPQLQQCLDALVLGRALPLGDHRLQLNGRKTVLAALSGNRAALGGRLSLIYRDVTEERRLQNELAHSRRMEAIGQLAGGVAHDFNNLLSVILGFSALVLQEPQSPDRVREDVLEIQRAGNRATMLVRQLLAFSRRQVLNPCLIDIGEVARGTETMLHRLLSENIEFSLRVAPDLGPVMADASQMEQVLLNLVVNARDAMPRGGKLSIEIDNANEAISLDGGDALREDQYVVISVTDTGIGMDQSVRERIFEPFFTTKEPGKGTGLGLATVYGIIQQSQGYIDVRSVLNLGSTFKIHLPRAEGVAPEPHQEAASSRTIGGSEVILLVEDDESVRKTVRTTLERQGYKVVEARNGDEAILAAAKGMKFGLMLTDIVMPGMSGIEVAEAVVSIHPGMKVVFMSGYADDALAQHGLPEAGFSDFLQKPFPPEVLLDKVRAVLDRSRANGSTPPGLRAPDRGPKPVPTRPG